MVMEKVSKQEFYSLIKGFEQIPFKQTEAWVTAQSRHDDTKLAFFVDQLPEPLIACVAHVKKKAGLKMYYIEAEAIRYKDIKHAKLTSFFQDLQQTGVDVIEINSPMPYDATYEIALRQAGFLRPVGQFSVALSSYIFLENEIKYNDNWKRNMKKAANNQLSFEVIDNAVDDDINDFIKLYNEMSVQKNVAPTFTFSSLRTLLASANFKLFFVKNEQNERIATILIHYNNNHAGLVYAASGEKAHQCAASFFMYDKLFHYLSQQHIKTFDMEKLAPSIHSTNAVFLFKNGIKGEYIVVNGEWSWHKNSFLRPLMYVAKKWFLKKIEW